MCVYTHIYAFANICSFILISNPFFRDKLGDIFSFYAGSRLVVVLNGYDVIREALVKKAAVFSHRAHTFMSQKVGKGRGNKDTTTDSRDSSYVIISLTVVLCLVMS